MIIYCGGDKGGTGKSLIAMLATHYFLDYYIRNGRLEEDRPLLIDTDRTNPNVFEVYKNCPELNVVKMNLGESEGWEAIVDLPDQIGERPVVINSGSTDVESIADMRTMLTAVPGLAVFWIINTEKDSIDLLGKFLDVVQSPCCVVKNLFFGNEGQFRNFDDSQFARDGMKAVYMPKASPSLIHILYTDRIPLHEISAAPKEVISIGKKAAAKMWCDKASKVVPEALKAALGEGNSIIQKYTEGFYVPADFAARKPEIPQAANDE